MNETIRRALTGTAKQPALTFERTYRATPAELREACTRPERLQGWLGEVHGNPSAIGDQYTIVLSPDPEDVAIGRILRCDDDVIIVSWRWTGEQDSVLSARITVVDDEHTTLTLQHSLSEAEHTVDYGGGWEQLLQGLTHLFGGPSPESEMSADTLERWRMMVDSTLTVEHIVPASIDDVWAAFTTTEGLKSWWWSHWNDVEIHADFREGGAYRIDAPGAGIELSGHILTLDEDDKHLAYTWVWESGNDASIDEAVDIRLEPVTGGTRVLIQHTGPWPDDAPAISYREGWIFTLSQLDAALA